MAGAPFLVVDRIGKSFGGVPVLTGVDFTIAPGEIVALIGENGSGKSTLMNLIAGVLQPDTGSMRLDGADYAPADRRQGEVRGVAFIQQELAIFPSLSVAQNLFLHRLPRRFGLLDRSRVRRDARRWLGKVGLDVGPERLAGELSPGQRQLLEIARGLSANARLMIFDEPTTSLSPREIALLLEQIRALKAAGTAILFVSHALEDVLAIADRLLVLRDGLITLDAPRAEVTREGIVEAMVGRPIESLFPDRENELPSQAPMLVVRDLGAQGLVDGIDLEVGPGEIVGIAGLMGSGRTELARILYGLAPQDSGLVELSGLALAPGDIAARLAGGMAFLAEDRRSEGLLIEADLDDNVALAGLRRFSSPWLGHLRKSALARRIGVLLQALHVRASSRRQQARLLSGGNQQKLLLGRWMLCEPKLFILDEPTRGVDIGAKAEIYALLAQMAAKGTGLLVISSELEELTGIADRILVMARGRISGRFLRSEFDHKALLAAMFATDGAS